MVATECQTFWEVRFFSSSPIAVLIQSFSELGLPERSFIIFSHPQLTGKVAVFLKRIFQDYPSRAS